MEIFFGNKKIKKALITFDSPKAKVSVNKPAVEYI